MFQMRFHIRTVIIAIQMLLVLLVGGTVGYLSYTMEIEQTRGDMLKVLSHASQDITNTTEIFLDQVKTGATQIGKMAEKGFLIVENQKTLAQAFTEYLRKMPMINRIGYIDTATGNATHVEWQPDQTLLTLITRWDAEQKAFIGNSYLEKDLNLDNPTTLMPRPGDSRQTRLFISFRGRDSPEWTHIRSPEVNLHGGAPLVFSYGYPIRGKDDSSRGLLVLDMNLAMVLNYLKTRGENLEFGGFSFAVEKNPSGGLVVIGNGIKASTAIPPAREATPLSAHSLTDSRIQAYEKALAQQMAQGRDPFNYPGDMVGEFKDAEGLEWICVSRDVFPGILPDWIVVSLARKDFLFAESNRRLESFTTALILILAGTSTLGYLLSGFLSRRLNEISKDATRMRRLDIVLAPPTNHCIIEIDYLLKAIEEMKAGLLSFQKFVPTEVVRQVVASGREALPGGEKKILTFLFTDLANFTSISEKLPPEELVSLISEHLAMGASVVKDFGGTVDKFIGDSIMAFWNAPEACEDHPHRAVLAALQMHKNLDLANASHRERGIPELKMRIGVNTGTGVVGNIGTETRLNYTALGDTVNLSSRLEGINKFYGTRILVSEYTVALLPAGLVLRPVDSLAVYGKAEGLLVYEALGIEGECPDHLVQLAQQTEAAWLLYQKRDWPAAAIAYGCIWDRFSQDSLAEIMGQRCRDWESNPPESAWDGTWRWIAK